MPASPPPARRPSPASPPPARRPSPASPPQLDFLQQHALATSIAFGPTSQCDAAAVLNHGAFAERNGGLLRQLQHLELSSQLDLGPYTALQSLQGTWQSEPQLALGAAQLSSLRLTPPLGAQQAQRAFQSRWLRGVQQLGSLQLMRFATADLSHVRGAANITLGSMQPPGGLVSPESLALPADGFGPGCALALRMAYAPPHAIHAAAEGAQHMMAPGALAAALQQHAAAAAAAAEQAAAALNAAQQQQQQAQQAAGQQQPAPQQQQPPQQQQQQALGPPPDLIDLVSDDEDDGPPPLGPPLDGPPPQFAPALPAPAQQGLPAPWPPAAAAPGALPAAGAEGGLVLDSDDEDDDLPELMEDDEPPPPLGPPAFVNQQVRAGVLLRPPHLPACDTGWLASAEGLQGASTAVHGADPACFALQPIAPPRRAAAWAPGSWFRRSSRAAPRCWGPTSSRCAGLDNQCGLPGPAGCRDGSACLARPGCLPLPRHLPVPCSHTSQPAPRPPPPLPSAALGHAGRPAV